jgi:hypothetical protein
MIDKIEDIPLTLNGQKAVLSPRALSPQAQSPRSAGSFDTIVSPPSVASHRRDANAKRELVPVLIRRREETLDEYVTAVTEKYVKEESSCGISHKVEHREVITNHEERRNISSSPHGSEVNSVTTENRESIEMKGRHDFGPDIKWSRHHVRDEVEDPIPAIQNATRSQFGPDIKWSRHRKHNATNLKRVIPLSKRKEFGPNLKWTRDETEKQVELTVKDSSQTRNEFGPNLRWSQHDVDRKPSRFARRLQNSLTVSRDRSNPNKQLALPSMTVQPKPLSPRNGFGPSLKWNHTFTSTTFKRRGDVMPSLQKRAEPIAAPMTGPAFGPNLNWSKDNHTQHRQTHHAPSNFSTKSSFGPTLSWSHT